MFKINNIKIFISISFLLIGKVNYAQKKINWSEDLQYAKRYLEIMHPHLFDFVPEEEFNQDFNYLFNNWQNLNEAEIVTRITEIFVKIQDGHTGVSIFNSNEYIKGLLHYYPVWLYKFNDGYFGCSNREPGGCTWSRNHRSGCRMGHRQNRWYGYGSHCKTAGSCR